MPRRVKNENIRVNFDTVSKYFDVPLDIASSRLKISSSHFKRMCRSLGIRRWPYRKLNQITTAKKEAEFKCGKHDKQRLAEIHSQYERQRRQAIQHSLSANAGQGQRAPRRRRRGGENQTSQSQQQQQQQQQHQHQQHQSCQLNFPVMEAKNISKQELRARLAPHRSHKTPSWSHQFSISSYQCSVSNYTNNKSKQSAAYTQKVSPSFSTSHMGQNVATNQTSAAAYTTHSSVSEAHQCLPSAQFVPSLPKLCSASSMINSHSNNLPPLRESTHAPLVKEEGKELDVERQHQQAKIGIHALIE